MMIDYNKKFRLDNKTAVVCGALGLLGKEVCIAFAQAGAKVIALDIDGEKGIVFEKECKKNNVALTFKSFDITKLDEQEGMMRAIDNECGPIQVFVNTSYPRTGDWNKKMDEMSPAWWQKNVDMQLNASCFMTKVVAERMKSRNIKGSIINLSSIYGLVAPDFDIYTDTSLTCPPAYPAIKGGIISFSRYAASYYGSDGIRINCICPGGIENNWEKAFMEKYEKKTLLKRMGKPEEIAATALFLASDASLYITGIALAVDGGLTCL